MANILLKLQPLPRFIRSLAEISCISVIIATIRHSRQGQCCSHTDFDIFYKLKTAVWYQTLRTCKNQIPAAGQLAPSPSLSARAGLVATDDERITGGNAPKSLPWLRGPRLTVTECPKKGTTKPRHTNEPLVNVKATEAGAQGQGRRWSQTSASGTVLIACKAPPVGLRYSLGYRGKARVSDACEVRRSEAVRMSTVIAVHSMSNSTRGQGNVGGTPSFQTTMATSCTGSWHCNAACAHPSRQIVTWLGLVCLRRAQKVIDTATCAGTHTQ